MENTQGGTVPSKGTSPFRARKDIVGRIHFRNNSVSAGSVARFQKFQMKVIRGELEFSCREESLAAHLIAFDGIAKMDDLLAALNNERHLYMWQSNHCIEWEDEIERINRRFLSSLTLKVWAQPTATYFTPDETISRLEKLLEAIYPNAPSPRIDVLLKDCQAYLLYTLPGPLAAHCLRTNVLSALPRTVFAREESRLTISSPEESPEIREVGIGFSNALDAYFNGNKYEHGDSVINQIVLACRSNQNLADHLDKREMLKRCFGLINQAARAGRMASLVLAWAMDLIESGTPKEPNVAPATVQLYVKYGAPAIYARFKDREIEEIDSDTYAAIYQSITNQAGKAQQTTASSLKSWHYFIQTWLDAAPLKISLYQGISPSKPKANVLWSHENQLISEWLDSAKCDERLAEQLRINHLIASSCRIRISELMKLRIRNIRLYASAVEIEISPLRRDGQLKTASSLRVETITDQNVVEQIRNWVQRRKQEGALTENLIFGDPHDHSHGYKLGKMYVVLNMLLKHVTGDRNASFHMYSHTYISNGVMASILAAHTTEVNPLDMLASDAGHASVQTSLQHYCHLFEEPLRIFLDKAIQSNRITGSDVEINSHISSAAFRQRCYRAPAGSSKNEMAWKFVNALHFCALAQSTSTPFQSRPAKPPGTLYQASHFEYLDVLNLLDDISNGISITSTSLRCGLSREVIDSVATVALTLLNQLGYSTQSSNSLSPTTELLITLSDSPSSHIQFSRVDQEKLQPLFEFLLRNTDSDAVRFGTHSWIECYSKGNIDLSNPARAAGIAALLHEANMPVGNLLIKMASPSTNDIYDHRVRLLQIRQLLSSKFSVTPKFISVKPRRGRAAAYLCVSGGSKLKGISSESAATSGGGLNAILFAASVYLALRAGGTIYKSGEETNHV